MCNKCRKAYGRGGWDRDKEGNDEFCRWVLVPVPIFFTTVNGPAQLAYFRTAINENSQISWQREVVNEN